MKVAPQIDIEEASPQAKDTKQKKLDFKAPPKGSEDSFSSADSFNSNTSSQLDKEDDAERMDFMLAKMNGSQVEEGPINNQKKNAPNHPMVTLEVMEESK